MTKSVVTLERTHVAVFRDTSGQVVFGRGKVTTCDLTASNGIIHTVDKVLSNENGASRTELMGTCIPDSTMDIRALFFRL